MATNLPTFSGSTPSSPILSTSVPSGSALSHSAAIALYVGASVLGVVFVVVLARLIFAWVQRFKLFQGTVQEFPVTLSETASTYSSTSLTGTNSPPPPYPGNSPPPPYPKDSASADATGHTVTVDLRELLSQARPHHKDGPSEEPSGVSENPAAE